MFRSKIRHILLPAGAVILAAFFAAGPLLGQKKPFQYRSHGNRDPFVPLVGVSSESGDGASVLTMDAVDLQGITLGAGGERYAIINGEILSEGDSLGQMRIITIEENGVVVRIEDKVFEKVLYKEGQTSQ